MEDDIVKGSFVKVAFCGSLFQGVASKGKGKKGTPTGDPSVHNQDQKTRRRATPKTVREGGLECRQCAHLLKCRKDWNDSKGKGKDKEGKGSKGPIAGLSAHSSQETTLHGT